ncbi:hypothetical protein D3C81_1436230 [compost metagenome]
MVAVEQLRDAGGGQLIEGWGALVVETERAATLPGSLDDRVVGQRRGRCGHGSGPLMQRFLLLL